MRSKLILIYIILQTCSVKAHTYCDNFCQGFEDTLCLNQLLIDSSSANIWQIGKPQKNNINTAISGENVIITDTINSYPINNYSIFTISSIATEGDIYGFKVLNGDYIVQSDSLKDYGKIEFSPDNGNTWIDLINDTVYSSSIYWYSNIPVLTGKSAGWRSFEVLFADNGSVFNLALGDTIKYRFSFFSDSIFDELDGLAFDNICFIEFVEGISETRFSPIKSKIYPNPSNDNFTIEFENSNFGTYELAIYTIQSKLVITKGNITENTIGINSSGLDSGVYVYKLTNIKEQKRSWGKFIISK